MWYVTECVILLLAYLIGSIPSGFLIARARGITDIRQHGSGNIGATNVARLLGTRYFFGVFFLDFFKAYAYILTLTYFGFSENFMLVAATALLLGNGCSLFLNFRGGKGVSTTFGILLALKPALIFFSAFVFFPVLYQTRTVGTASVVTLAVLPLFACFIASGSLAMLVYIFCTVFLGLFWHHDNIIQMVTIIKK